MKTAQTTIKKIVKALLRKPSTLKEGSAAGLKKLSRCHKSQKHLDEHHHEMALKRAEMFLYRSTYLCLATVFVANAAGAIS